MKFSRQLLLSLPFLAASFSPLFAEEEKVFSGEIGVEAGGFQTSSGEWAAFQFSKLEMESHQDLLPGLSFGLEGQAEWQSASSFLEPPDTEFPVENILPLEAKCEGGNFYSLELYQANLRLSVGRLDLMIGLFKPVWGSSRFYKPTDYFFPQQPLLWEMDLVSASEGLDANVFLFDDLTLEGGVRWLEDGKDEWVLRLVNKGIGITATPSFARMLGKNGLGLELSGTFPEFQLRLEGVDWLYPDGSAKAEWVAGFSTLRKGLSYTLEIFRDETGGVLGGVSATAPAATYLHMSMEKSFEGGWKAAPALVKAFEGGPFLFWPKIYWDFAPSWEAALQGQFKVGTVPGPLSLVQNRLGLSTSFFF